MGGSENHKRLTPKPLELGELKNTDFGLPKKKFPKYSYNFEFSIQCLSVD